MKTFLTYYADVHEIVEKSTKSWVGVKSEGAAEIVREQIGELGPEIISKQNLNWTANTPKPTPQ